MMTHAAGVYYMMAHTASVNTYIIMHTAGVSYIMAHVAGV